jgi:hypothetical protein
VTSNSERVAQMGPEARLLQNLARVSPTSDLTSVLEEFNSCQMRKGLSWKRVPGPPDVRFSTNRYRISAPLQVTFRAMSRHWSEIKEATN